MNNEIKTKLKNILLNHIGRHNSITRRELLFKLNYKDDRSLRVMISELIDEGLPVLSSTGNPGGYYLPANWAELKEGQETLKSYIIDLCVRKARLKVAGAMYLKPAEQQKLL